MDVILLHDMDNLGGRGETCSVSDGYARNYLFPQNLAVRADTAKVKELEMRLKALEARDQRNQGDAEARGKALEGTELTLKSAASDEDKLYGSVTARHIVEGLAAAGHEVRAREVKLVEPIRTLGEYPVTLRLHRDVSVEIQVKVERA